MLRYEARSCVSFGVKCALTLPLHIPICSTNPSGLFLLRSKRVKILLPSPPMIELWHLLQSYFSNNFCPFCALPSGKGLAEEAVAAPSRIIVGKIKKVVISFMLSSLLGLQMGNAHHGRRVRVVELGIQRIGGQCRRVVLIQLNQRVDQVGRVGLLGGISICLKLMFARIGRQQRMQQKAEYRQDHEEQQQRERGGSLP